MTSLDPLSEGDKPEQGLFRPNLTFEVCLLHPLDK